MEEFLESIFWCFLAIGIVCFITSIFCFFKHCSLLREEEDEEIQINSKSQGVKKKILKKVAHSLRKLTTLRIQQLLKSLKIGYEAQCAICLDSIVSFKDEGERKNILGVLNKCSHIFHFDCVWKWIESNSSCPICRAATKVSTKNIQAVSSKTLIALVEKNSKRQSFRRQQIPPDLYKKHSSLKRDTLNHGSTLSLSSSIMSQWSKHSPIPDYNDNRSISIIDLPLAQNSHSITQSRPPKGAISSPNHTILEM